MSLKSKYKPGFIFKRAVMSMLFSSAGVACLFLSQLRDFQAQRYVFIGLAVLAFGIMLFVLYNFLSNRLESLEIGKEGLTFRNGLTRRPTVVAWKNIKRYGTGKSEHYMGFGTSEGDTSIVIETHGGEQFSFSEEEYANYEELKKAFLAGVKR